MNYRLSVDLATPGPLQFNAVDLTELVLALTPLLPVGTWFDSVLLLPVDGLGLPIDEPA